MTYINDEKADREANCFARCLLMPESFVLSELKKMGKIDLTDPRQSKNLADRFGVSEPMITIRLVELGLIKI